MNLKDEISPGNGWAWAIQDSYGNWQFCNWVKPTKDSLSTKEKPSPEAKKIYVRIISNKQAIEIEELKRKIILLEDKLDTQRSEVQYWKDRYDED